MNRARLAFALSTFVLALVAGADARADAVFPPGLRVGLEPAGDLKARPGLSGFQDPDRKTAVVIAEFPSAAYDGLLRAMDGKPPPGATEIKREAFSVRDGTGQLHAARLVEDGVATRRWLLLAKPADPARDFVALLSVSVPEPAGKVYSDAVVRKMLASVSFREPPIEEQLGLIPFKLDNLAGFRVVRVTPDSVLVTEGPDNDLGRHPYAVVSIGTAQPAQMDDRARFSRDLLAQAPVRELRITSADEMRIGGRAGFEIRGSAKDPAGNAVSVVQWVRFTGGGFMRIVGVSPTARWDAVFNRFRALRDGVELR